VTLVANFGLCRVYNAGLTTRYRTKSL